MNSQPTNGDNRDYLDKAVDAAQKKFTGKSGNRATTEKITDFMRKQFEKMTGKKVPNKVSN